MAVELVLTLLLVRSSPIQIPSVPETTLFTVKGEAIIIRVPPLWDTFIFVRNG